MCLNYLVERGAEQKDKPKKTMAHDPFWDML